MSHEGYMAHPVHAYWDDFWAMRGFKDAAAMAAILGEAAQRERITALCDGFSARRCLASLDRGHPANAGWTSCPARSSSPTSILRPRPSPSPWPTNCTHLPRPAIDQTYEKYLEGFRKRRSGAVPWANYSAYEIRIIGALVRLGRRRGGA